MIIRSQESQKKKIFRELLKQKIPIRDKYLNLLELPLVEKKVYLDLPQYKSLNKTKKNMYRKDQCPVVLEMNESKYMSINLCVFDYTIKDMDRIYKRFEKVWKKLNLETL